MSNAPALRHRPATLWLAALALVLLATTSPTLGLPQANSPTVDSELWAPLRYRHVGPIGNRVSAVVGVPGDPNTYYVGAASGGVWKTTDGGVHWRPVFDDQPVQSIGSLAIAPSDPNVVWAGTGETFIRSNVVVGNGAYKSQDGGESWQHMGLPDSGRIGRIVVHPSNPDTVWVAALGHCYGPQQQRGVFKTTDGGNTWRRVLFVHENAGAIDIAIDPGNPRILYAAMWQLQIWTWGRESGGPGGGIHRSVDGGETWVQLTEGGYPGGIEPPADHQGRGTRRDESGVLGTAPGDAGRGLPRGPLGKIGLAVSADDPARLYALIETSSLSDFAPIEDLGVLWRSDDRGMTWSLVSSDHTLTQRPLYYTRAVVAPDDANEVHFLSVLHTRSLDGGASIERLGAGGDNHDMWIDPLLPDRMIVGNDQGVAISNNRGRSWFRPFLPVAQMYHVSVDDRVPYFLYGNRQDGSSFRGPSNSLSGGSIPVGAWHSVGGCESGFAISDPVDQDIVWSGCYDSILERYDLRTGHSQNVSVWPDNPEGWPAAELKYRFQWTFPIAISPHDHNVVYAGSQYVHRTTNGGNSWEVISPDLTTNDKELQLKSGGLTADDSSPTYSAVLFAIAESPLERGVIWTGSNDGLVHISRDGGAVWTEVTPEGLPPLGTIGNVEPSRHTAGSAYLAVDMHQVNSTEPHLYRTTDYGASWTRIVDGIVPGPLSYTHVIREDPVRPGLLYAGTGNGLYVSFDDGGSWQPLQNNLPRAPVHWLTIQERFNDLVVATYGRGFWILDDISPLQQMTDEARAGEVWLFDPRPAYRFLRVGAQVAPREDPAAGENPEYGAIIHYLLSPELASGNAVQIDILDAQGRTVRSLDGLPGEAGLHRVVWNLRMEASSTPELRTQPLEHPHAEFNEQGWRRLVEGGRVTPLAPPGTYTVRLSVGEQTAETILQVRKDPNSAGTLEQIERQEQLLTAIRDDLNAVVDLIDEIEWLRKGIDDLQARLSRRAPDVAPPLDEAVRALDDALIELEGNLFDLRLTGGTAFQDSLRWPRRLYAKLASLGGYVGGTDFAPTAQQIQVHDMYRAQLQAHQQRMEQLREQTDELNKLLADGRIGILGGGIE